MKELNRPYTVNSEAMPEPQPTSSKRHKETPRWIVTKHRTDKKYENMQNDNVEAAYHRVIAAVKELVMLHGGDNIYERNQKEDPECFIGIHSFFTSTFYWQLDCELNYNYEVYFTFHNCPYEAEIRKMFKPFPLDRTTHEQKFINGYPGFYQAVMSGADKSYITALKGTDRK